MRTATEIFEQLKRAETSDLQSTLNAREAIVAAALEAGEVPDYLLALKEVVVEENGHRLVYLVSPDYITLGTAEDAVRMPMLLKTARAWMKKNGYILPTRKMVEQIWGAAGAQAYFVGWGAPYDMKSMTGLDRYVQHSKKIDDRLGDALAAVRGGDVIFAGGKKDLISSPRQRGDNIVIYGGPLESGGVQQYLMADHGWFWIDYSQCFRMVATKATLDGVEVNLIDVMKDPVFAGMISDEGHFSLVW